MSDHWSASKTFLAVLVLALSSPTDARSERSYAAKDEFKHEQSCRVVGVSDGDTITVLCAGNEQVKVRLAEIDAPEKRQPFGNRSRQSLSDLCYNVQAEIRPQTTDRYGRTVARVTCRGRDAGEEQIRRGLAWVFDRYVTDRGLYQLQDEARAAKRGLWADGQPVPPWEWRKDRRNRASCRIEDAGGVGRRHGPRVAAAEGRRWSRLSTAHASSSLQVMQ